MKCHENHKFLLFRFETGKVNDSGHCHGHLVEDLHNGIEPYLGGKKLGKIRHQEIFKPSHRSAEEECPDHQNEEEDVGHEGGKHDDFAGSFNPILDHHIANIEAEEVQQEERWMDGLKLVD